MWMSKRNKRIREKGKTKKRKKVWRRVLRRTRRRMGIKWKIEKEIRLRGKERREGRSWSKPVLSRILSVGVYLLISTINKCDLCCPQAGCFTDHLADEIFAPTKNGSNSDGYFFVTVRPPGAVMFQKRSNAQHLFMDLELHRADRYTSRTRSERLDTVRHKDTYYVFFAPRHGGVWKERR
jgi:hypothetical protein